MKRLIWTVLISVAASLAGNAQDEGRCLPVSSPKVELARSDAVFIGSVLEKNEFKSERLSGGRKSVPTGILYKVRMRVERSWKGTRTRETAFLIYSGSHSETLFTAMKEGQKFLVYAINNKALDELIVSGCMRTRKLQDAREDLSKLGKGKKVN